MYVVTLFGTPITHGAALGRITWSTAESSNRPQDVKHRILQCDTTQQQQTFKHAIRTRPPRRRRRAVVHHRLLSPAVLARPSWALGHSLVRHDGHPLRHPAPQRIRHPVRLWPANTKEHPRSSCQGRWSPVESSSNRHAVENQTRRPHPPRNPPFLAYVALQVLVLQPPPGRALTAPGMAAEHVVFRVGATTGMGISLSLLNLIMANVANILMVAVGASRPEDCPALDGSPAEAYSPGGGFLKQPRVFPSLERTY